MVDFAYLGPASTKEEALARLYAHHDYIGIDTETIALKGDKKVFEGEEKVSLDARTCIGFGIAISPVEAFYFPLGHGHEWKNVPATSDYIHGLLILSRPETTKVGFNMIFDLDRIQDAEDVVAMPMEDVSIGMQVQGLHNSLDACCNWYLGIEHQVISDILPARATMLDVPFEKTAFKCMNDCMDTLKLFYMLKLPEWGKGETVTWHDEVGGHYAISPATQECYRVDRDCIPLLRKMSQRGIVVDPALVDKWYDRLTYEMKPYEEFFQAEGFNPGSPYQVGLALAHRGNFLPLSKSGKQLQTSEELLTALPDPVANMVISWRKRQKLLTTYINPMRGKTRVYTHFRLDLATGRLGSYEFNSQNLPPAVREVFCADNGEFTWMDYSQIEFRVFAVQSKDPAMIEACKNPVSPHMETFYALYPGLKNHPDPKRTPQYTQAKTWNFALLYDAADSALATQTGLPIPVVARQREVITQRYPVAMQFIQDRKNSDLFYAPTDFDRRCRIPTESYITEDHKMKCKNNYATQGTAADIIKRAMLECDRQGIDFPFQVHDELVADGKIEFPSELSRIHPEVYTPFESHTEAKWY